MTWYQIINTKSDSYVADRDAEDPLRQVSMACRPGMAPWTPRCCVVAPPMARSSTIFRCRPRLPHSWNGGATSYDATELAAPSYLTGMEKIRRV